MRRIIVIDDEPNVRLVIKGLLIDLGCEVVAEGGDGTEAVGLCREHKADVVLMDVMLPTMDGIEAVVKLNESCPTATVIMTGRDDSETIKRAVDAGVMAYLAKPVRREDLLPAIELATTRFGEFEELRKENRGLKESIEARKVIEKAKGLLMERDGLSESDAFRRIQKTSMSQRRPMKDVAEVIVATMSNDG